MPSVRRTGRAIALAVMMVGAVSCQNLEVNNTTTPGVDDVFNGDPVNLEGAIAGAWFAFWGVAQGARTNSSYPVTQLSGLGEELTSATLAIHNIIQEPRVALDNRDAGQWTNRKPWYDLYEVIANTRDALQAIERGQKIGVVNAANPNGADTPRAKVFSKFLMGVSHIYLGLLFDQAFITDETTNPDTYEYEFSPYTEVVSHGIAQLEEAIAEAKAAPNFTLPTNWVNGQAITRDELVRIMYSYIVRGLVYSARNPAERTAVDWTKVLTTIDLGIQKPFVQQAVLSNSSTHSAYVQYTAQLRTDGRTDNHLVGPADTSGAYQRWVASTLDQRRDFQLITPDRRIHGAAGPTTRGTIIQYDPQQSMTSIRGTYMHSRYRGARYATDYYRTGLIQTMTPLEMDFIRAEAYFRLNRRADVVTILNRTRVPANLKPVTVDGPPPGADCVPRKTSGACGDLWDALMYEKRIELYGLEAIIPFADRRGWGLLAKGTLVNFPVHGRELETLGKDYYSFGGDLPGSAP